MAWLVATFASIILAAEPDFAPCLDETLTPGCPGTIQWDGGAATTAWATSTNWSTDVVPGTSDDVCIPELGAGVEVVHSAGTDAVNSIAGAGGLQVSGGTLSTAVDSPGIGQLVLSGGTLALTGTLPVAGGFSWTGGTLTGSGSTTVSGGSLTSGTFKDLTGGRILQTSGTTVWSGTGSIRLDGGSSLQNAGTWDNQGNAVLLDLGTGGGFANPAGSTFRKSAGGATTSIQVPFTNGGTVAVENGTLSLEAGGTAAGAFTGTAGTTLRFGGGTHGLGSASSVSAATVAVAAGSVTVDGTYAATATTVSAGTLTFNPAATVSGIGALSVSNTGTVTLNSGEAIAPPTLSFTNGTIGGTDPISVSGAFTWSGGGLSGNAAVTAPMGIAISSGTFKELTGGRTLSTGGTTTWAGTGSIRLGSGGSIQNGGIWDIQGNATMVLLTGGGGFTNPVTRTLRKSAGGGLTTFDVAVTNEGSVSVESGTLSLDAGSTSTGSFTGGPGTTLRFGGGTHGLGNASSVSA
ncbi:MAG TPA: hypothetical protein VFO11_03265, partial [Candidatus Polarisedimenticolaceae bacterium]|nr:hypothetical protein [Candidatus Polarisedimenticolaceae bacterium]